LMALPRLDRQGWRVGLLVARNVDEGNGRPCDSTKVSVAEFARMAGTPEHLVKLYLEAWELAADRSKTSPTPRTAGRPRRPSPLAGSPTPRSSTGGPQAQEAVEVIDGGEREVDRRRLPRVTRMRSSPA
jgi:hypothetical protein